MIVNVGICATFLIVLTIIISIYFSKTKIDTVENNIFKRQIGITVFGLLLESIIYFLITNHFYSSSNTLINLTKMIYVYYVFWMYYFVKYNFVIFLKDKIESKKMKKIFNTMTVIYIFFLFISIILPIDYELTDTYYYPQGIGTQIQYIIVTVGMVAIGMFGFMNIKKIKSKESLPMIFCMILGIISIVIQYFYHEFLFIIPSHAIAVILMYFTIENPDMKMLSELHKSKEISDTANEEKTLFLYNMTQEIRNITSTIDDDADLILDSKDWEETYDSARDIKANTSKFTNITNDILDVSNIDSNTIKVYNEKYNIKNILKQLISVYGELCKNKNLKIVTNIDHDIPEILYGDSIDLKEILTIILNNSIKYTNKGFVEFDVNTVIKNDICRLIITIEDSGMGIKSEDINKIKLGNKSLAKANKLITTMGGAMMISSDYGKGTKVKVILDQKIEEKSDSEVAKYEETFDNIKILSVDDSEAGHKIIEKLLKGTNIILDIATTGKECLDKLKVNKYNLILLDEELGEITGIDLMKKMKELRNFNTPVIFLTKDNSYEYNEEYSKVGFIDYLLKPLKKEELINKIDRYTKKDKK